MLSPEGSRTQYREEQKGGAIQSQGIDENER